MVEEILNTRLMVKKAMSKYKDDKVKLKKYCQKIYLYWTAVYHEAILYVCCTP